MNFEETHHESVNRFHGASTENWTAKTSFNFHLYMHLKILICNLQKINQAVIAAW